MSDQLVYIFIFILYLGDTNLKENISITWWGEIRVFDIFRNSLQLFMCFASNGSNPSLYGVAARKNRHFIRWLQYAWEQQRRDWGILRLMPIDWFVTHHCVLPVSPALYLCVWTSEPKASLSLSYLCAWHPVQCDHGKVPFLPLISPS